MRTSVTFSDDYIDGYNWHRESWCATTWPEAGRSFPLQQIATLFLYKWPELRPPKLVRHLTHKKEEKCFYLELSMPSSTRREAPRDLVRMKKTRRIIWTPFITGHIKGICRTFSRHCQPQESCCLPHRATTVHCCCRDGIAAHLLFTCNLTRAHYLTHRRAESIWHDFYFFSNIRRNAWAGIHHNVLCRNWKMTP